jgi:hypothetical protein
MSRVTEAGMGGAQEDVQRTEQRAVGEREVRWSARRKEGRHVWRAWRPSRAWA